MSKDNKKTQQSPFNYKGKDKGDHYRNFAGRLIWDDWSKRDTDAYGIEDSKGKVDDMFSQFQDIDTTKNLWEGAENLINIGDNFGGLENQFADNKNQFANMENTMEDLTVNQQQAQFESQQGNQQRSNILQGLKGSAGGSGIAGLAQAMANQGQLQNQKISASIGRQESVNNMAKAQQAASLQQQEALGQTNIDTAKSKGQADIDMQTAIAGQQADIATGQGEMDAQEIRLQGEADSRDAQLDQRQAELLFLSGQLEGNKADRDEDIAGK